MSFVDTSNSVNIKCGITGSYKVKGSDEKTDLPSGLLCVISTSLQNVAGEWHRGEEWKADEAASTSGDNYIEVLEPDSNKARGVCIDFAHCSASITDSPGRKVEEGELAQLEGWLKAYLEKHFANMAGLRYCIAAVSNHYYPKGKDTQVLQPTHFCFTVMPGMLLMWIGLKGGPDNGTRQSEKTSLAFAPDSKVVPPIPDGHSASIIFSHFTMANLFLKVSFLHFSLP